MNPQTRRPVMGGCPQFAWIRIVIAVAVAGALVAAGADAASAQGKRRTAQRKESKPSSAKKSGGDKSKVKKEQRFDFTGFELAGSVRMPQLLYFLDRAEEELERASLERRTFVPEMLKSLDEENL